VNIIAAPPADWRNFMNLAKAELKTFLRGKKHLRPIAGDLLSVATIALAEAKPSDKWARKAIQGALTDYVRDRHDKVMRDPEMREHDVVLKSGRKRLGYRSTMAEVDDLLEMVTSRETYRDARGVLVCPPPRRIRRRGIHPITGKPFELPSRIACSFGYQVNSRHWKVVIPLTPLPYIDEMGNGDVNSGSRKRASLFEDEANPGIGDARPEKVPQRGDIDNGGRKRDLAAIPAADQNLYQRYTKKGGGKRWAQACLNHGETISRGLDPPVSVYRTGVINADPMPELVSDEGYPRDSDGAEMARIDFGVGSDVVGKEHRYLNRNWATASALVFGADDDDPPPRFRKLTPATLVGGYPRWRRPWCYEWTVWDHIYRGPWNARAKALWVTMRRPKRTPEPLSPWQTALIEYEGPKCTSPADWRSTKHLRFSKPRGWGLRSDVHLPPGYFFEKRVIVDDDGKAKAQWLWVNEPFAADNVAKHLDRWIWIDAPWNPLPGPKREGQESTVRSLRLKPE
jgi:hypothetical protein